MPTPARRTGQTASFFPDTRSTSVHSSGVSTRTVSVARSFVASYVSSAVSSRTIRRKSPVEVRLSRRYESLCRTSGWSTWTTVDTLKLTGDAVGRVAAEPGVEGALSTESLAASRERAKVNVVAERAGDDLADLAEVALVEA